MKPLKSDSIFDWWDTPKSQDPELFRATRSKANFKSIWSNWSGWSDCETKFGESKRFRECRGSFNQSKSWKCRGLSQETRDCSEIYCKQNDCSKGIVFKYSFIHITRNEFWSPPWLMDHESSYNVNYTLCEKNWKFQRNDFMEGFFQSKKFQHNICWRKWNLWIRKWRNYRLSQSYCESCPRLSFLLNQFGNFLKFKENFRMLDCIKILTAL